MFYVGVKNHKCYLLRLLLRFLLFLLSKKLSSSLNEILNYNYDLDQRRVKGSIIV